MWIELKDVSKKYYEGNKKYVNRLFRNRKLGFELNAVSVYEGKASSHIISLYSLKDTPAIIKSVGPTRIQFFVENEKTAEEIIDYLTHTINEDPTSFNEIYNSKYADFILE